MSHFLTSPGQITHPTVSEMEQLLAGSEKAQLLADCVRYFRENPGFHRMFRELKEKYRSFGAVGGSIQLANLQPEEKSALSGLLRKDYTRQKSAVLKVARIAAALGWTRFAGLDLEEVVLAYWGTEILPKRKERQDYLARRQEYFDAIGREISRRDFSGQKFPGQEVAGRAAGDWLAGAFIPGNNAYKTLITRYDQNPEGLRRDLLAVGRALNELPYLSGEKVQLPLFASRIAADPHYFDDGAGAGQLLIYGLMHIFGARKPETAAEKAELLYRGGLYNNEVPNFTICSGLLGYVKGGEPHQGWLGFYRAGEPLQVSLGNLSRLERVESPRGVAFVVENPAVFAALLSKTDIASPSTASPTAASSAVAPPPLVCTNGQVNLASLVLLDLLAKSGARLLYSGDFDPEGLLIADKLKGRYGAGLEFWHYMALDYKKTLSPQKIAPRRLKQLSRLRSNELASLGRVIAEIGYAGYQELLIDELRAEMSG